MTLLTSLRVRLAESVCGQTMTEYVLIISAVAVALLGGYHVMGSTLTKMVQTIAAAL